MAHKRITLDKDAEELIRKCEDKEIDTNVMGACRILLEEMDRGQIDSNKDESYIQMAQRIAPEDVPKVLKMALEIRENKNIKDPEIKIAANRLIRAIEML